MLGTTMSIARSIFNQHAQVIGNKSHARKTVKKDG